LNFVGAAAEGVDDGHPGGGFELAAQRRVGAAA
jgi:hypothetical protein